jgi:RNA-binding protein PNO1
MSRCIGRICGEKGKTKFAIENATKTRIIVAETRVHMLGRFNNIKYARDAICNLILGSPPGKVYSQLRTMSKRYMDS